MYSVRLSPKNTTIALLAGVTWLTFDLLRVWMPSIITIFGQAAETPAAVLGGYALTTAALPALLVLLGAVLSQAYACSASGAGYRLLLCTTLVILVAVRCTIPYVVGQMQLWISMTGVVVGVVAMNILRRTAPHAAVALLTGYALSTSSHALLGSYNAVWRTDGWGLAHIIGSIAFLVFAVAATAHPPNSAPPAAKSNEEGRIAPHAFNETSALWIAFPMLFVLAISISNPGRASAISPTFGAACTVIGVWAAVAAAQLAGTKKLTSPTSCAAPGGGAPATRRMPPNTTHRVVFSFAAIAAVLSVGAAMLGSNSVGLLPPPALAGWIIGPIACGYVWGSAERGQRGSRWALPTGFLLHTVFLFAFYAGYVAGYRADWLVIVITIACAAVATPAGYSARRAGTVAARIAPAREETGARGAARRSRGEGHSGAARRSGAEGHSDTDEHAKPSPRPIAKALAAGLVCATATPFAPNITLPALATTPAAHTAPALPTAHTTPAAPTAPTSPGQPTPSESVLRVMAYNTRSGFDNDGTFNTIAMVRFVQSTGADVLLLSEVDRGWWINGGHDQLTILARSLGWDVQHNLRFGAAADQIMGDAILSRYPLTDTHYHPLPTYGALTGSQALEAVVQAPGGPVRVISTHLQADGDEIDHSERVAADLATILRAAQQRAQATQQPEQPAQPSGQPAQPSGKPAQQRSRGATQPGAPQPVVAGGDMNTRITSTAGQRLLAPGYRDALSHIPQRNTWPAAHPTEPIDHVLVTGAQVRAAHIPHTLLSDHLPVVVDIALPASGGVGQKLRP